MEYAIPSRMKAMVLTGHGGIDKYEWHEDWPVPEPAGREVLIRVSACGLNNTDVNTRIGWYARDGGGEVVGKDGQKGLGGAAWGGKAVDFPRIQGADICGHVVATASVQDKWLLGRRVITDNWLRDPDDPENPAKTGYLGSEADGGFAEYARLDARNVGAINCPLTDAELATFPCSGATAEGMLARAGVSDNDTILITGASGGVGSALIQLAKARGARVVALAAEQKHPGVRSLGADHVLPREPADVLAALDACIGTKGVTVVADVVGRRIWPQLIRSLAPGGRYVCSGAIAGAQVALDLRDLYLSDLSFYGSTITSANNFQHLCRHIEQGRIKPALAATFPLAELVAAQEAFLAKRHTGNIVVIPS